MSPILAAALAAGNPQVPVDYYLSFENAAHHEASITATFAALPDEPLVVRMARSSPGRYALHEFARNVDDVSATDGKGNPLEIVREDPYRWIVKGHDGVVKFHYTLYADRADGTYSQVDTSHAHLNMPATLAWSEALADRPVSVRITPYRADWKVATQLEPTDHPYMFRAPDLQYLMDSPVEISNFDLREWQVTHKGETATIRLAVHHGGTRENVDTLEARTKKIVDAHIALWDDLPDYDYGTYTFLADYLPWVSGDGMEHRNSTVVSSSQSLTDGKFGQLGTISHEYFHGWNVERMRPADLEPFDFTKADVSQHLWLAEGFTTYYDDLLRLRAGDIGREEFLAGTAGLLTYVLASPATRDSSPAEMSRNAPYMDAAKANDPDNFINSKLSYYPYGAAIGIGLDLALRARGTSLDAFMRALWASNGATGVPYRDADIEARLAEVSDPAFARKFMETMVHGDTLPDYDTLLAPMGYRFVPAAPDKGSLGFVQLAFDGPRAILASNSVRGTAVYRAGLDRGDEVVSVNGRKIASMADWKAALASLEPGSEAVLRWKRRDGSAGSSTVTVDRDPSMKIEAMEPDAAQAAMRKEWLGESE